MASKENEKVLYASSRKDWVGVLEVQGKERPYRAVENCGLEAVDVFYTDAKRRHLPGRQPPQCRFRVS
jgi:hypothetical protein